jgi:hypothetical protein
MKDKRAKIRANAMEMVPSTNPAPVPPTLAPTLAPVPPTLAPVPPTLAHELQRKSCDDAIGRLVLSPPRAASKSSQHASDLSSYRPGCMERKHTYSADMAAPCTGTKSVRRSRVVGKQLASPLLGEAADAAGLATQGKTSPGAWPSRELSRSPGQSPSFSGAAGGAVVVEAGHRKDDPPATLLRGQGGGTRSRTSAGTCNPSLSIAPESETNDGSPVTTAMWGALAPSGEAGDLEREFDDYVDSNPFVCGGSKVSAEVQQLHNSDVYYDLGEVDKYEQDALERIRRKEGEVDAKIRMLSMKEMRLGERELRLKRQTLPDEMQLIEQCCPSRRNVLRRFR